MHVQIFQNIWILCFCSAVLSIAFVFEAFITLRTRNAFEAWVKGKSVLITGGEKGLGKALVKEFVGMGADVIVWGIDEEKLKELQEMFGGVRTEVVDVSDSVAVGNAAGRLEGVSVLVNNAGVVCGKRVVDLDAVEVYRIFGVNTLAHFWTTKAFLPKMLESDDESFVVSVTSSTSYLPGVSLADYAGSKAATANFMDSLRLELAKLQLEGKMHRVHTLLVCPFIMDSEMFQHVKLNFSWLFPRLSVNKVAHDLILGMARKQEELHLPYSMGVIPHLLRLMPTRIRDFMYKVAGGVDGMDSFHG